MSDDFDRQPTLVAADLHARVRETAFALLMTGHRPVPPDEVGAVAGIPRADLIPLLDELAAAGWIDRDPDGHVTGSGGLSLTDGPHQLLIGDAAFRNWCAYDSLGIAAATQADATIRTTCPVCGAAIEVRTIGGEPPSHDPARLWLADGGNDLRADFCAPTVLLCSADHAGLWAERQGGRGRAVDLTDGARLGREAWADCARAVARVSAPSR